MHKCNLLNDARNSGIHSMPSTSCVNQMQEYKYFSLPYIFPIRFCVQLFWKRCLMMFYHVSINLIEFNERTVHRFHLYHRWMEWIECTHTQPCAQGTHTHKTTETYTHSHSRHTHSINSGFFHTHLLSAETSYSLERFMMNQMYKKNGERILCFC